MLEQILRRNFNAIIEGPYDSRGYTRSKFKLIRLNVPRDIDGIDDGLNMYDLVSSQYPEYPLGLTDSLDIKKYLCIGSLQFRKGLVVPQNREYPSIIENPRVLFLRDGRVYLKDSFVNDQAFMEYLKKMLIVSNMLFKDKESSRKYKSHIN